MPVTLMVRAYFAISALMKMGGSSSELLAKLPCVSVGSRPGDRGGRPSRLLQARTRRWTLARACRKRSATTRAGLFTPRGE